MKFADKLFFAITAVLTLIFAIYGSFITYSSFQKTLNREIERGRLESQMFQYLFELSYQSVQDYGQEYAVTRAIDSVMGNVEKEGVDCFVLQSDDSFLYGQVNADTELFTAKMQEMKTQLQDENSYVYGIRQWNDCSYLLNLCRAKTGDSYLYLGMSIDLTSIYEDRTSQLHWYRLSMLFLLLVGGSFIYILSHYLTRPISNLGKVAGNIASGDFELRSQVRSKDEIGELASSFNQMADRLVEQMKEKELEAKQKEDFTAAFAHELKTPLTSIIGYADMLNSVNLSEEERREAYFYIYSQGKRLESLSHKLLELVSTEHENMKFKPVPTKMLEENLRTTMRPVWESKKIRGKIVLEKATLHGDSELLLSLLYNLLDNATKAVEEDGFILLRGNNTPAGYEIKVVDNGRGIPKEEINRITEAFYMVDKSRSRKEGGAGIGMALCKQIITLHNGTLKIDSKLGEGTVIKLLFQDKRKETTE